MTRKNIPWAQIILESAFVVFGVVLALAANEWRGNRADKAAGKAAAVTIGEEVLLNRESVVAAISYHIQVSDSLAAFSRRNAQTNRIPGLDLFPRGFISTTGSNLLTTAWEVAAVTGAINHIPYSDVLAMSRVYDKQSAYRSQSQTAGDLIYKQIFEGGTDAVRNNYRNLLGIIQTFVYVECGLIKQYDQAIAELAINTGPDPLPVIDRCQYYLR